MNELLQTSLSESISVEIGTKAPDFKLKTEEGNDWQLSNYLGNVVTLLFYPKDETLVCTRQLCSVRDNWSDYLETKSMIVGISPGTTMQHRQFALRHKLPLPLLADADQSVTKTYSFHWFLPAFFTRAIIVIDANGVICSRKIMLRAFRPTDSEVLASIYRAKANVMREKYDMLVNKYQKKT